MWVPVRKSKWIPAFAGMTELGKPAIRIARYPAAMNRYASFREFYPFYLSEHANRACRRLHFIGTSLVIVVGIVAIVRADARWLLLAPVAGYGFAWAGHFFFEKNRPATFTHPLYSLAGDWAMYWDVLRGRVRI